MGLTIDQLIQLKKIGGKFCAFQFEWLSLVTRMPSFGASGKQYLIDWAKTRLLLADLVAPNIIRNRDES